MSNWEDEGQVIKDLLDIKNKIESCTGVDIEDCVSCGESQTEGYNLRDGFCCADCAVEVIKEEGKSDE